MAGNLRFRTIGNSHGIVSFIGTGATRLFSLQSWSPVIVVKGSLALSRFLRDIFFEFADGFFDFDHKKSFDFCICESIYLIPEPHF